MEDADLIYTGAPYIFSKRNIRHTNPEYDASGDMRTGATRPLLR